MALSLDTIRATADRIAGSHGLVVVDVEFAGGGKHRALRVFVEKNEAERKKLAQHAESLPKGVPVELLSGVTHEDCEHFARDFSTVLDVEDLVPGSEYTLEVSSPGLERKLRGAADYERFKGSLVKLQTFTPVPLAAEAPGTPPAEGGGKPSRHFIGRLAAFDGQRLTLDLSAVKQKGKAKKTLTSQTVTIDLANVEKANLVAEI